jgi:glucosamine kinase
MSGDVVLGIDGGGSKTLIAVADRAGRVIRTHRGRPSNPLDDPDWQKLLAAELMPFARIPGLAGVGAALAAYAEVEALSAAQRAVIAGVFGAVPQRLLNDVDGAHLGAFAGGSGVLILSGTGSMAWARDGEGRSFRTGGWGDIIGDEGSSHWIGQRVLAAVSQSIDGRAGPTGLRQALFEALGIDDPDPVNGLEGWISRLTHPRSQIASLAPLATRLAATGDAAALRIIEAAADELARHITTVAHKANLPTDWSYAGGTLASALLRDLVAARIGSKPAAPRLPPIGGALIAAAQHVGWTIDETWIERLKNSIETPSKTFEPQPIN